MPKKKTPRTVWLRIHQVISVCKKRLPKRRISAATLYRHVAKKQFPKPSKICGVNYWRKHEINAWLTRLVDGK